MMINPTAPIKMPPPYGAKTIPVVCKKPNENGGEEITIQIVGVIECLSQFIEVIDVLGNATEKDTVRIVIDTPGGNVFTTQIIVAYMVGCKAPVTTVASGLVASAGTIIWFYGANKEVDRWARFMFHGSSHGSMGRSTEILEEATELVKFMDKLLKDMVASGLITTAEYDQIVGKKEDTYVSSETMRKRLLAAMQATESLNVLNEDDPDGGDGDDDDKGDGKKKEGDDEGEKKGDNDPEKKPEDDPDKKDDDDEDKKKNDDDEDDEKKKEGDDADPEDKKRSCKNKAKSEGEDGEGEPANPENPETDPDKKEDGEGEGDDDGEEWASDAYFKKNK